MEREGWWVKKIHGSIYQIGLPDLIAIHPVYGTKWIEMKVFPNKLENSQKKLFGEMQRHGAKVYILRGVEDYHLLFEPCNCTAFMVYGHDCFQRKHK